jgi:hypothetical protein
LFLDPAKKKGLRLCKRKSSTKWEVPHLRLSKHLGERRKVVKAPIPKAQSRSEKLCGHSQILACRLVEE